MNSSRLFGRNAASASSAVRSGVVMRAGSVAISFARTNPQCEPPYARSKVHFVVMARRDDHLHPFGKKRPEAGPRFHYRVPVLGLLVAAPIESAEIIDDAQMRRGGEVREAETRASQPTAMVEQIIDIIEMLGRGAHRFAQDPRVRTFAIDQPLSHAFVHQWLDSLTIQLDIEPFGHPADFSAQRSIAVDHRHPVDGFVEIFDDGLRTDQGHALVWLNHDRGFARRVQVDELVPALPRILSDELMTDALLGQHQPDLARKR